MPILSSTRLGHRVTRAQLAKLRRSTSTKSERRIAEVLKANHIAFRTQVRLGRYEVDFIIGRIALEVDGSVHGRINQAKDAYLFSQGYIPLHVRADVVTSPALAAELLTLIRNNNVNSPK